MAKNKKAAQRKLNLNKLSLVREPLKNAGEHREACHKCGLYRSVSTVGATLPRIPEDYSQKLLVVTDTPSSLDGAIGKLLRRLYRRAGWKDSDVAVVCAVRCASRGTVSMTSIRACRPFLLQVIHKLKPKNVLGLGSTALRALRNQGEANLTRNRGKEINIPKEGD